MADPRHGHVRDTDAFTFRMERDPLLRSTIVVVATFDRTPDWEVLVDRIERATRLVPSFRSRLVPSPLGLAPPRWVVDPDFEPSWHLRREVWPPGTPIDEVFARAQLVATEAFDPARPLWRFTLVEGLADGKAALVMKVHHALTRPLQRRSVVGPRRRRRPRGVRRLSRRRLRRGGRRRQHLSGAARQGSARAPEARIRYHRWP